MTQRARDHLGRFGVWRASALVTPEIAVDLERLGYGTLWLGGSPDGDLRHAEELMSFRPKRRASSEYAPGPNTPMAAIFNATTMK